MTRLAVSSSSIKSIGREDGVLEIEFKDGRLYQYPGVSDAEFQALIAAPSIGKHFHQHIRGKYSHVRVEPEPVGEQQRA